MGLEQEESYFDMKRIAIKLKTTMFSDFETSCQWNIIKPTKLAGKGRSATA